jgi:hypothetical protein
MPTESNRRSVGQSLSVSSPILGPRPEFRYSQTVADLLCGALSLTRGWVCRLQLLLAASAVILRLESHEDHDHILLSQIRDSLNLEGKVPAIISPRNCIPLSSAPTTRRATVEVFKPASPLAERIQVLGRTYRLISMIRYRQHRKRRVQQFFCCACVFVAAVTFLPFRCLATIWGCTYKHTDWWEQFMKYAIEMGSGAKIYIPSFLKTGLIRGNS